MINKRKNVELYIGYSMYKNLGSYYCILTYKGHEKILSEMVNGSKFLILIEAIVNSLCKLKEKCNVDIYCINNEFIESDINLNNFKVDDKLKIKLKELLNKHIVKFNKCDIDNKIIFRCQKNSMNKLKEVIMNSKWTIYNYSDDVEAWQVDLYKFVYAIPSNTLLSLKQYKNIMEEYKRLQEVNRSNEIKEIISKHVEDNNLKEKIFNALIECFG